MLVSDVSTEKKLENNVVNQSNQKLNNNEINVLNKALKHTSIFSNKVEEYAANIKIAINNLQEDEKFIETNA